MHNKKFTISVIIPVYNVEKYLEETIKSVIDQSIGFEKNIQIVLVNDGSIDNSHDICIKYKDMYPENILYIKQENQGVSVARNTGLENATGEFISFLDSDDKWEKDSLKKGVNMLKKNPNISLVMFRIKYFDAAKYYHVLDYKFHKKDRIVNLENDYENIQLSCCTAIFRRDSIGDIRFNSNIKIGEDARFVNEVILNNLNVGIISSSNYLYRKRKEGTSAIQNCTLKKTWYTDSIELFQKYILNLSIEKYGSVIPYVQYLLLYDIQWRVFYNSYSSELNEKDILDYKKNIHYIVKYIDDNIIMNFHFFDYQKKVYFLKFKYESNKLNLNKKSLTIDKNNKIENFNREITIDNIISKNNMVEFYCSYVDEFKDYKCLYFVDENNKKYEFSKYELDSLNKNIVCLDDKYSIDKVGLKCLIDISKVKKLCVIYVDKKDKFKLTINIRNTCPISSDFKYIPFKVDKYNLFINENSFIISKRCFIKTFINEIKVLFKLIKLNKLKCIFLRELSIFYKLYRGEIWIVSDRLNAGCDNGEAFFKYLVDNNLGPKHKYFLLSKKSSDYKRLSEKYDKYIIDPKSLKYKLLFINSDKIISAHADNYVINPFGNSKFYLQDKFKFKFIFLQHGIIKNDLSSWLNVNNKKIDMFVTSCEKEYQSILSFNYNYDKENVKLTGIPRYDLLKNEKLDNIILLMPTWRSNLVNLIDKKTGKREYDSNFKNTDYFNFYNKLINDKKLLNALKKYNYKIRFVPHTNMIQQLKDFDKNEYVIIENKNVIYKDLFNESKLLVTDYSSVSFDFSYLKKPIVLCQFDKDSFFDFQIYDKGYFDEEKDQFGPVCYDIDDTVNSIIKYIENDCKIEKEYLHKIENFYKFFDTNNCERVYKEINKL